MISVTLKNSESLPDVANLVKMQLQIVYDEARKDGPIGKDKVFMKHVFDFVQKEHPGILKVNSSGGKSEPQGYGKKQNRNSKNGGNQVY